ncbi:MAG: efflux transporter outer membrane subunit [Verrucomicrobiales bacterium]|nr:efflux transporter outer membrane subunit [Verrucomicrobiales bacterium]
MFRSFATLSIALVLALGTGGCVVDPSELGDSSIPAGESYQNGSTRYALLPAGRWWDCFDDAGLRRLIEKLDKDNPSLAAALARYDRTRTELGLAKADQLPTIYGDTSVTNKRDSASGVFVPPDLTYNEFRSALNLEYEIDLWGRVRRTVEASIAETEAAEADWAAAKLSLRSELARTYFNLRFIDSEIAVLKQSVELRRENWRLIDARVRGGETTDLDLARAETELETTRAQLLGLQRTRATYFNALAFLCGEVPGSFELPSGGIQSPPQIPSGLPSELLSRRPDIAAADSRMRAAAARIGAVRASYLPSINLVGVGGLSSLELADFFDPTSFFGSIGPQIRVPIYNAGRSAWEENRAFADSDEAVAIYRETVLGAFRDVEDALSGIRFLDREIAAHLQASSSADRAARLSQKRYDGGLVSYLEVVDAERTALTEKRSLVQARSARLLATVQLIEALGGGWEIPIPDSER